MIAPRKAPIIELGTGLKPRTHWLTHIVLSAVVLAGVIPFASRAVYLDEHIFLLIAENTRNNFFFPQDTPTIFFGTPLTNLAGHTHPPVGEYYLAFLFRLLGRFSEAPFRIGFAVFPIMAALGFYRLARRWTQSPFEMTLLLVWSPAFFVMAPTLMMDIPMLAFLLVGLALYSAHLERRGRWFGPASAAAFVLAVGTGYTALVPLFCLGISVLLVRRSLKDCLPILAAPAALALWQVAMAVHFGTLPVGEVVGWFYPAHQGSPLMNAIATFSFLGGLLMLPWTNAVLRRPSRNVLVVSLALSTFVALLIPAPGWLYLVWFAVLMSAGLAVFLNFVSEARQSILSGIDAFELFLVLWAPATLLFFIIVGDMIAARYVLLAIPPILLIGFRRSGKGQLRLAALLTLAISIPTAIADTSFVNSYREWVEANVVPVQRNGIRVWGAAESGLRFYLEQKSIETLSTPDVRPAAGDRIVRHVGLFRYALSPEVEPFLSPVEQFDLNSRNPMRTFNLLSGAGFHDSRIGLVPYTFAKHRHDRLEIVEFSGNSARR